MSSLLTVAGEKVAVYNPSLEKEGRGMAILRDTFIANVPVRQNNFRPKCLYVAVMLRRMMDAILNKDAMDDKLLIKRWAGVQNDKVAHIQEFSKFTRFVVGDGDRIRFWDDLWWGDQTLGTQYPRLLSVVTDKNAPISSILGYSRPFSWNFNFRRNLTDSEIEDLESLMRSLDRLHISPSVPDKRSWSISPLGLFTVKSFFLALSQYSESPPVFPTKFVWNSQVPFKVKSFVWLVAHKKLNTNDLLQLRRPHKALSPNICKLCMKHGETVDHLFLHCSLTKGLWHRLFQLAKMDWVSPRSISDMFFTNFNGFGSSKRGVVLWQDACIALMWWCGGKGMQGFLRIKQGIQGFSGILFVFWLLYGLFVLRFLKGYLLTCYNLIG
ncbi:DNA-directed RNA polymerase III subunit 2 [Vitis vinifera]|uniref:DNA-directed RNA polymerase III subunit 2 n=1 Tax=Vitis vinifera TaxID=29760 RepID=A0A438IJQ4_VITVI|nr:DNA-directed RNA polymerase III subunit 2 [Vitis vinifera]